MNTAAWCIGVILLIFYFRLILSYRKGIDSLVARSPSLSSEHPDLTVVVPFRNEKDSWRAFVSSAEEQDYPGSVEYLFINDHSEDGGEVVLRELLERSQLKYQILDLPVGIHGKKFGLHLGFKKASTPWVICTDADTTTGPYWLFTMSKYLRVDKSVVAGPVQLSPSLRPHQRYMALEFTSLMASVAGSIASGRALMAGGGNLAVRRAFFLSSWSSRADLNFASGDDLFLIHQAKSKPESIDFVWDGRAMVSTPPPKTYSEWWTQRRRWASKSAYYKDKDAQSVSWIVFLYNLFLVVVLIWGLREGHVPGAWWWAFIAKFLIDYPMLKSYADLQGQKLSLGDALATAVLYPFAIVGTAIHSQLGDVEWKGRKTKA
ncbi:glycosyltransferase [Cryomorphaceae bacterium]|nr:glycosyltransferase [Cryomorphaceae bacterium]